MLFKQMTAYEVRISDWSSDVCSSDLGRRSGVTDDPPDPGDGARGARRAFDGDRGDDRRRRRRQPAFLARRDGLPGAADARRPLRRSEEHTSELQSRMRSSYAVFCVKKTKTQQPMHNPNTVNTQTQTSPDQYNS